MGYTLDVVKPVTAEYSLGSREEQDKVISSETVKPSWKKQLIAFALIVIIVAGFSFYLFVIQPMTQYMSPGIIHGSLTEKGQETYRFRLDKPMAVHIGLYHDAGNDFDLYLFDEKGVQIAESTEWLASGEYITFTESPLPAGVYTVIVKSFSGSGQFQLFLVWPLIFPLSSSDLFSSESSLILNGTLNRTESECYVLLYIPSVYTVNMSSQSDDGKLQAIVYDSYGSLISQSAVNTTSSLELMPFEQYRYNIWVPSNLFILKIYSGNSGDVTYRLKITYCLEKDMLSDLAQNTTYTGKAFNYHYEYEYKISVPTGVFIHSITDAVPLIENLTPYLISYLERVYYKSSGENLSDYSFLVGDDGQKWVGFTLTNLSEGVYTVIFRYNITDLSQSWNQFDPLLTLVDVPIQIRTLWTRPEGFGSFLEIPSNATYFRSLAENLTQGLTRLGDIIQALYEYVVAMISYSDKYTSVWALLGSQKIYGNCHSYSTLLITLARALGIPAREAAGVGVSYSGGYHTDYHGWVEIFYPDYGWIPVDPTWVDTYYGDLGVNSTIPLGWYESMQVTGSHIRFTYWLQFNGSVWWSYGPKIKYLGSPYPEPWFILNFTGVSYPDIYRGFGIKASA
ncbi:MAG: transglutaminase-like domain-containing protein [Candidatus Ranarchaeia archaeon]